MTILAAAQLAPVFGDPHANLGLVAEVVASAAQAGAKLIVLPELVSSGYMFSDVSEAACVAEVVDGPTLRGWAELAARHDLVIVGGFCERGEGDHVHNSAAILDRSGLRAVYRKAHLWDRERLIFTPGDDQPPLVETEVGVIATMICYDLEFPEWVRLPALGGAQLLAAPVNWPSYPRPDDQQRPLDVVRVQADASVNRMAVVVADRVGTERDVDWVGGSTITDVDGWIVAGGTSRGETQLLCADVDLTLALDKGVGGLSDIHRDRRPELYSRL